jgi:hypothetical protein
MFTFFDLLKLVGVIVGISFGVAGGTRVFGVVGGVTGALVGGYLGFVLGRIPENKVMRAVVRQLRRKSVAELRAYLHSPKCPTPNFVLLELRHRGEDTLQELPVVLDLLVSEDEGRRGFGWAALASAFPELAEKLRDYRIGDSIDECKRKVEILRRAA